MSSKLAKRYPALDAEALQQALTQLPLWRLEQTAPGRQCLQRHYRFRQFQQAVQFMQALAPVCDELNHHPDWRNCHRDLYVSLSSWDVGHRLSQRDFLLAERMEEAFTRDQETPQ